MLFYVKNGIIKVYGSVNLKGGKPLNSWRKHEQKSNKNYYIYNDNNNNINVK